MILLAGCRTAPQIRQTIQHETSSQSFASPSQAEPIPLPGRRRDAAIVPAMAAEDTNVQHDRADPQPADVQFAVEDLPLPASPATSFSLTLDEAIATALDRNPSLIALRGDEPVAHAAFHVAEIYPWNPTVQVQVLPYSRDRTGDTLGVKHSVELIQTLELAHQRRHREASAAATWRRVQWNIVQAELDTTAQVESLYFTALYQRDLRDLARQSQSMNEDVLGIVERRFNAGLATPAEQTTARITARQSRRQARLAEATFQTALLALQRQLNLSANEPITLVGRLEDFTWLPIGLVDDHAGDSPTTDGELPLDVSADVVAELASARPDVMAAEANVSTARANADLAWANRIQNIGIGPFYERDESGTETAGFLTQMNLPVWDTGRALAQQREAEFHQQLTTLEQLYARAHVEAETATKRYERARQLAEREGPDISQTISHELQAIKEQFAAGQANILDVFATQNGLLLERRGYLDLLNELAQAAADLTRATGLPPNQLVIVRR